MAILKSETKRLRELERENAGLRSRAEKQKEMLAFLGVLNDVDIEELMDENEEAGTDE